MKPENYYSRFQHYLKINLNQVESFRVIKDWLRGRKKIIDLGCGLGYLTSFLEAVGIDNDLLALEIARKNFPKTKFILADIRKKLPFKNESADAILCYNVLEHLTDPERKKIFGEIKRVLKREGIFIAAYLDEGFWFNRLLTYLWPDFGTNDPTHQVSWSLPEFKRQIARHFTIVKEKQTSQYGRLIFITRFFKGELVLLSRMP